MPLPSLCADADRHRRGERLDALPFTRRHLRVLTGSGLGWALDAMDVGLVSFVLTALIAQWSLTGEQASWIASAGFVGMAVGASLGGLLADRFGRRSVFAVTLLVYGLATGASALAGGLAALIALRVIVGLGLGAELPVASTYVSEVAPARMRGRLIVILEAFWALGWTAAALIGFFVIPASADGWRWAFALGRSPRSTRSSCWSLPESPRWLARRGATRGRRGHTRVRVVAGAAGNASSPRPGGHRGRRAAGGPRPARTVVGRVPRAHGGAVDRLVLRQLLVLRRVHLDADDPLRAGVRAGEIVRLHLIITLAQLPGYAVAAWLIEVWGRRVTLSAFLAGSALAAIAFGTATGEGMIIAAGWRCRSSTSARGAHCTPSPRRTTPRRCVRPEPDGPRASDASRPSSRR
jgi:putative MFS transporter